MPVKRHGRKSFAFALPVKKVEIADWRVGHSRVLLIEGDQPLRLWIWKWIEEYTIDYGKQRSACANAHREGGDGDDGECRRLGDETEGVANVLHEGGQEATSVDESVDRDSNYDPWKSRIFPRQMKRHDHLAVYRAISREP